MVERGHSKDLSSKMTEEARHQDGPPEDQRGAATAGTANRAPSGAQAPDASALEAFSEPGEPAFSMVLDPDGLSSASERMAHLRGRVEEESGKVRTLTTEMEACLEMIPKENRVLVQEGGGPTNIPASLAVSLSKLVDRSERQAEVINEVHNWAVCAAITTPEDMAQNFPNIVEITSPKHLGLERHVPESEGLSLDNPSRARWAQRALEGFARDTGLDLGTDRETAVADLLADLMHDARLKGMDFGVMLATARRNFREEVAEELEDGLGAPGKDPKDGALQVLMEETVEAREAYWAKLGAVEKTLAPRLEGFFKQIGIKEIEPYVDSETYDNACAALEVTWDRPDVPKSLKGNTLQGTDVVHVLHRDILKALVEETEDCFDFDKAPDDLEEFVAEVRAAAEAHGIDLAQVSEHLDAQGETIGYENGKVTIREAVFPD